MAKKTGVRTNMTYPFRGFESWQQAPEAPSRHRGLAELTSRSGQAAAQGHVIKTIMAGQSGSKRWQTQFGDALLCVRYREDLATRRRYTTIEIVVDERDMPPPQPRYAPTDTVAIRIALEEGELRGKVKAVGGQWDHKAKLWRVMYAQIQALALESRIVRDA